RTAKMKKYKVEGDKVVATEENIPVPVERTPISVTMARIGDTLVVDPNSEEEVLMDVRITITTDDEGNVCASQKGEASTISPAQVLEAADTSIRVGKQIRAQILEATK
ncbi:MAG TPA: exosome complex component Rrp42, partial [Nitrososphaerales archaeon]|nr:exosome complex component Rrp42 [Nitrososphaerales archaeon]